MSIGTYIYLVIDCSTLRVAVGALGIGVLFFEIGVWFVDCSRWNRFNRLEIWVFHKGMKMMS